MEHESGCHCERCKGIIAAIISQDASGEYFFSDEELDEIFVRDEEPEYPSQEGKQ